MNFDLPVDRTRTASQKWDNAPAVFGAPDVLPMWVADMDFAAPPAVIRAMHERVEHGVFGYTFQTDSYKNAIADWMKSRHDWTIDKDWMQFCPGVVPAMSLIVQAFTEPGDQVLVQTPVYAPFYSVVEGHGRELVLNPLRLGDDGQYSMDFDDLEQKLAGSRVKMMLLCSPHNPVGRVWTKAELARVAELCAERDVLVVSDEIHADLIFEPGSHTPFAALSADAAGRSIICTAPSKTFNIAGLNSATIIIANEALRQTFVKTVNRYALGSITPFGLAATEAAYKEGGEWLDAVLRYIRGNMDYVRQFFRQHLSDLKANDPQATYLMWLDFRGLGLNGEQLNHFLVHKAKLGLNAGTWFGGDGEGFMRMNVACSRGIVEEAMRRLQDAVQERRSHA